jgi:predicted AlkP superfamily pyrophosphatase or phosphodiesterase
MIYFISICLTLCIVCYGSYQDIQNKKWKALVSFFESINYVDKESKSKVQMVFFKYAHENDYDYFNSMKVVKNNKGITFKPTLNHYFLKPLFIPWIRLEKIGDRRLFILKREVFKINGLNILIAF